MSAGLTTHRQSPGRVWLLGNYPPDHQQSMARFADCLREGLGQLGIRCQDIAPLARFHRGGPSNRGLGKWLGYLDKYLLFRFQLRRLRFEAGEIVHICDHSNSMYAADVRHAPVVITCHDLLAVRGAQGDPEAYCSASRMGRQLQAWILRGLSGAEAIVCDTEATRKDLDRLLPSSHQIRKVGMLPLNRPYGVLNVEERMQRLTRLHPRLGGGTRYVLHVGSSLPRKNREGVLRAFALLREGFEGMLVFAGAPLSTSQRNLMTRLGIGERVLELPGVSDPDLEALYGSAHALLFPSFAEGFGWPVIEAQACDCPVITSNRTSLPEVAGAGGIVQDPEDHAALAKSILDLLHPNVRETWIQAGRENLQRFTLSGMMDVYLDIYRRVLPRLG